MNLFLFIFLNFIIFAAFIKISHLIGFVDRPNFRKKHFAPISLIGGVCIYFSLVVLFLFKPTELISLSFVIFFFLLILIGLVDDKNDINPTLKLFLIICVLFLFFYFNQDYLISFLRIESYGIVKLNLFFSFMFSILCFSLFINAMNMIDGINGLSSSIFIFFINFLLYKLDNQEFNFLYYINIPLMVFLFLNISNKIFLGDHGIYLLAMLTACLSVKANFYEKMHSEQLFLLFMIPGIDMLRLFLLRIKNKKHPFLPDNNHIHHILSNKLNKKLSVILILLLIIIPNIVNLFFEFNTLIIISINLLIYLYVINKLKLKRKIG